MRLESTCLLQPRVMVNKLAVFSPAPSLGVTWSLRNLVSLRIILMLANTAKCAEEALKRYMTKSEETMRKNFSLLTAMRKHTYKWVVLAHPMSF